MLVHDEVRDALADGRAVVALESTIISHGLPRPDNARLAREFEQAVRDGGAVPATVAVIDGQARIGLDDAALDRLANDEDAVKVSVRELAADRGPRRSRLDDRRLHRPPRRRGRASRSSRPAGSAASTAARRTPSTSPPT